MTSNEFRIAILKAPSEEGAEQDSYVQMLNNNGFPAVMLPTLEFQFKNLDALGSCLRHPEKYSGIIVNSPRCARAVTQSFKEVSNDEKLLMKWKKLKCYVVGDATARLIADNSGFIYEGNDCGNLSNLLELIAKDTHEKPFLMPVGNLHKSANDRVTTEKVEVYETIEHPQLKENLSDILENNDIPLLITFFSPSGVKSALPYIKRYPMKTLKFIALGPTTARELENCHLNVDGICAKPSPENLLEVIRKMMS